MKTVGVIALTVPGLGRLETKKGTKFNPGGITRNIVKSDFGVHHGNEMTEASVEGTLVYIQGLDLVALNKIEGVVLTLETDTGEAYMIRDASSSEPNELTAGEGEVSFKFFGQPAVKI